MSSNAFYAVGGGAKNLVTPPKGSYTLAYRGIYNNDCRDTVYEGKPSRRCRYHFSIHAPDPSDPQHEWHDYGLVEKDDEPVLTKWMGINLGSDRSFTYKLAMALSGGAFPGKMVQKSPKWSEPEHLEYVEQTDPVTGETRRGYDTGGLLKAFIGKTIRATVYTKDNGYPDIMPDFETPSAASETASRRRGAPTITAITAPSVDALQEATSGEPEVINTGSGEWEVADGDDDQGF